MDLICPIERMPGAISALNQLVSESGASAGLKMWITRGWLDKIKLDGATVNELGIEIPCNSWNPGPSSETCVKNQLRGRASIEKDACGDVDQP